MNTNSIEKLSKAIELLQAGNTEAAFKMRLEVYGGNQQVIEMMESFDKLFMEKYIEAHRPF